ncbi:MAG: hypothetical protein U0841_28290 [Chloroflexia bacterium]
MPALADEIATAGRGEHRPFTAVSTGPALPDAALAALAADLASTERGLIVCGPQDDPALAPAVARLAAALGYPLLADGLSQTRSGPHDRALVIDTFDAFLRDDATCRALAPEVVLRFGAPPTSKPLAQYLARYPASRHLLIDGVAAWHPDPPSSPPTCCTPTPSPSATLWRIVSAQASPRAAYGPPPGSISPRARAAIDARLAASDDFSEGASSPNSPRSCRTARPSTPGTACRCATSTPFSRRATAPCAASRTGAQIASTASTQRARRRGGQSGAGRARHWRPILLPRPQRPARREAAPPARGPIVVVNNDGGGIFSFLPQASTVNDRFEQLFGTPIGLDYAAAAASTVHLPPRQRLVRFHRRRQRHRGGSALDRRSLHRAREQRRPTPRRLEAVSQALAQPAHRTRRRERPSRCTSESLVRSYLPLSSREKAAAGGGVSLSRLTTRSTHRQDAMPHLTLNGLDYHYTVHGAGPALILLHGFTGSAANWTRHIERFAGDFTCIAVDLPGHGAAASPADPPATRWSAWWLTSPPSAPISASTMPPGSATR